MTNYEKIKNMSVEEIAKEIFDKDEEGCRYCSRIKCSPIATERDCISGIVEYLNSVEKWLESEVEE